MILICFLVKQGKKIVFATLAHNTKVLEKEKAKKRTKKCLKVKLYIILFCVFSVIKEEVLFKIA